MRQPERPRRLPLALRKVCVVEHENSGKLGISPKDCGNGYVRFGGAVDAKRGLAAVDAPQCPPGGFVTKAPKRRGQADQMVGNFARRRCPVLAKPVSYLDVMEVGVFCKSRCFGLLGGGENLLLTGELKTPP